jgi:hypothetical protein
MLGTQRTVKHCYRKTGPGINLHGFQTDLAFACKLRTYTHMPSIGIDSQHVRTTLAPKAGEMHVRPTRRALVNSPSVGPAENAASKATSIFLPALVVPNPAVTIELICPDEVRFPVAYMRWNC